MAHAQRRASADDAAIGFIVKSGWAAAVLLAGMSPPRVISSRRIDLADPAIPESRQPYHAGFGTARAAGGERSRLVRSVAQFGSRSVNDTIEEFRAAGGMLRRAAIVVGSLIDPDTIANDHIRIHALEGRLFRTVVEEAARRSKLSCEIWRERDLYGLAASALRQPEPALRRTLGALGEAVEGPWRSEQKAAALAAWLLLARDGG